MLKLCFIQFSLKIYKFASFHFQPKWSPFSQIASVITFYYFACPSISYSNVLTYLRYISLFGAWICDAWPWTESTKRGKEIENNTKFISAPSSSPLLHKRELRLDFGPSCTTKMSPRSYAARIWVDEMLRELHSQPLWGKTTGCGLHERWIWQGFVLHWQPEQTGSF